MTTDGFYQQINQQLHAIKKEGLYKQERIINSPQQTAINVNNTDVINFCANNYLGLANHPELINAAKHGLDTYGFGMASVRFICGTQKNHKKLEAKISEFLGMEDSILYSSCFDANAGLFETLLDPEDAIISDSLNHASIIDGIRLCKAKRYRYANNDMQDLASQLQQAKQDNARHILIVTDGVFSMDGTIANLQHICQLAEQYNALTVVDDSHAVGFIGEHGRGTHEYCQVMGKIDIITGTLGKALGGASGGYIAAKKDVIDWLRQRSRPYLFSNSLAPSIVSASIKALDLIKDAQDLRQQIKINSNYFRQKMTQAGFILKGADHAIIPIMIGDANLANTFANRLLEKNIYVISFSYPVVAKGLARIRTQMSAAHTKAQLDIAIDAFIEIGKELRIIK